MKISTFLSLVFRVSALFSLSAVLQAQQPLFTPQQTAQQPSPAFQLAPALPPATAVVNPGPGSVLSGTSSMTSFIAGGQSVVASALDTAYTAQTGKALIGGQEGSFGYYLERYDAFNSTPYLYIMGLPLGGILEMVFFRETLWALALLFFAASIASKMRSADASFVGFYLDLFIKVMVGGFILTQPRLIYATCSVVMHSGYHGVKTLSDAARENKGGVGERMATVLAHAGNGIIEIRQARDKGIVAALGGSQAVFYRYANSPKLDEAALDYWATFFNALSKSSKAIFPSRREYADIPRVGQAAADEILKKVVARYADITFDSANLPADFRTRNDFTLNWQLGSYKSTKTNFSVAPLAVGLAEHTKDITKAYKATASTQVGLQQRRDLLEQYEGAVRDYTAKWITDEYLANFSDAMEGAGELSGGFSDLRTIAGRNALGATKVVSPVFWASTLSKIIAVPQELVSAVLTPIISYVAPILLNLFLELSILGLMIATPFWFFDGTKKAFTGAFESTCAATLIMPSWVFFQVLLDLMFATITYLLTFGGMVAVGANGAAAVAGMNPVGGIAMGASALILSGALAIGYFVASILLLFKTPSLVKSFLDGAGFAAGVMGVAGKGVIAAGAAAVIGGAAAAGLASAGTVVAGQTLGRRLITGGRQAARMGLDMAFNGGNVGQTTQSHYRRTRANAPPVP